MSRYDDIELDEDEIDKMLQAMFGNPVDSALSRKNRCKHEFIEYNGFREKYHFCKHCDKKKEIK